MTKIRYNFLENLRSSINIDRPVSQLNIYHKEMTPRRQTRNEEIREASIGKILDAALELFSSHGYEYTSMSQIARVAGISKGLIYNYFESKEQMLHAMIENLQKGEEKYLEVFKEDDPRSVLENMFILFFQEIQENIQVWRMITALSLQLDKFDFIHDMAHQKFNAWNELIGEQLLKIGYPNAEKETKLLTALFDGIGLHYLIIREDYPLDEMKDYLIQKYCRYEN